MSKFTLYTISLLVVLSGIYLYYFFFGSSITKNFLYENAQINTIFSDIENTPPKYLLLYKNKVEDCSC